MDLFVDDVTGEVYEYYNIDKLGYKQYKIKGKKKSEVYRRHIHEEYNDDVENADYQKKEHNYIHNDVKRWKEVLRTPNRIMDFDMQNIED